MKQFYKILLRKIHFNKKIFSKKIKMQFFFLINRDAVLRLIYYNVIYYILIHNMTKLIFNQCYDYVFKYQIVETNINNKIIKNNENLDKIIIHIKVIYLIIFCKLYF